MADPSGQARTERVATIAAGLLLVSLALSIVYAAIRLAGAPVISDEAGERVQADYALMIIQCAGGLVVMFLPAFIERRFSIRVSAGMQIAYFAFLFAAIYLGEVRSFYYRVPYWDSILHFFSGAMLGVVGFLLVRLLNDTEDSQVNLSPEFVAFFAFCFAVTCGVVWEIYEFTIDGLAGTNMQRMITDTGQTLAGRDALTDTMKDLIVDTIAAASVTLLGYLSLRRTPVPVPAAEAS